jgi:hypothetical protein
LTPPGGERERRRRRRGARELLLEDGGLEAALGELDRGAVEVARDPAAAEPLRDGGRGAGAAEAIEHQIAGARGGGDDALDQRLGLLRLEAGVLGGVRGLQAGDAPHVVDAARLAHAVHDLAVRILHVHGDAGSIAARDLAHRRIARLLARRERRAVARIEEDVVVRAREARGAGRELVVVVPDDLVLEGVGAEHLVHEAA